MMQGYRAERVDIMAADTKRDQNKDKNKVKESLYQWEGKDRTGKLLKGEIRAAGRADLRLKEAAKLGFASAFAPAAKVIHLDIDSAEIGKLRHADIPVTGPLKLALLHELGEDIDLNLMLGPAEYARAVMSLCRASGNPELTGLAEDFLRSSRAQAHQSPRPASRYAAQLAQQQ